MCIARRHILLLVLLILVMGVRFLPGAGEIYATLFYPHSSALLSGLSSFLPVSIDEIVCLVGLLLLLVTIIRAIRQRWGWTKGLLRSAEILCWYYVWFQLGWGCNYYRADFYQRMGLTPATADKTSFMAFANDYRDQLNASWDAIYLKGEASVSKSREAIVAEIKRLYLHVPAEAGLCPPQDYQQPKQMLLNPLYSAAGVLGFMGPWMNENLLNDDLLPVQFPSVYAHELSHLLGITSEAEASYWAYHICTLSTSAEIRYSGYQGILPYLLSNAMTILTEEEYREYLQSFHPEILNEFRSMSAHWQGLRNGMIDSIQNFLLDLQLKGHGIPSGVANYNQVIQMIISAKADLCLQNP